MKGSGLMYEDPLAPCVGSSARKPKGTGLSTLQEGLLVPLEHGDLGAPSQY